MKRATVIGIGIGALVVVGVTAGLLIDFSGSEQQPETSAFDDSVTRSTQAPPTVEPTPSPVTIDDADRRAVETAADDLLEPAVAVIAEIDGSDQEDALAELSPIAAQAFLSEVESERLEFAEEGWTREGQYSFDDVEVVDFASSSSGNTATVRVCLDGSALVTRREDGTVIDANPGSARAWNVFVLQQQSDSSWLIVGRTFPDDPRC